MILTCEVMSALLKFEMPNSQEQFKTDVVNLLSVLQNSTPKRAHTCIVHILRHFPAQIAIWGPVAHFWMYSYERYNVIHFVLALDQE